MNSYNSFEVEQQQVLEAARILNLDRATCDLLLWPQREFKFTMPVKMDNGEVKMFHGYRIQYQLTAGLPKGASGSIRMRRWTRFEPWQAG